MIFFIVVLILALLVLGLFTVRIVRRNRRLEREKSIRTLVFSDHVLAKVRESYPALEDKDTFLIARALREFFLIHGRIPRKTIGMPSKAVDELWHAFILDTRAYSDFCRKAFGHYFHHVPASKNQSGEAVAANLRRTWWHACLEENINPKRASRIPLLFAIDDKLRIPGGNHFTLASFAVAAASSDGSTCGSGCSNCGGDDSSSASDSSCGGDSSGCSGGCGGSSD